MGRDFSWTDNSDSVAFKSVRGVAVYANQEGDVVIRQQAGPLDDGDAIIIVPVGLAGEIVDAIRRACLGEGCRHA